MLRALIGVLAVALGTVAVGAAASAVIGSAGPTRLEIEPPASVREAGGSELAQFNRGRDVVAQAGCLACHRIGRQGNQGPGENLTHIGTKMRAPAIARAILHPRPPMPAFTGLSKTRLHSVVLFLSLLR